MGTERADLGRMQSYRWLLLVNAFLGLAYVPSAAAASVECSDDYGSCSVSNDNSDLTTCTCTGWGEDSAGGTASAGSGGNDYDGLTADELLEICEEQLAWCRPAPVPPEGVACENEFGRCTVDNDPSDFATCACRNPDGGSADVTGGTGGSSEWADLTEPELQQICFAELESMCAWSDTDGAPGTTGIVETTETGVDTTESGAVTASSTGGVDSTTGGEEDAHGGTSGAVDTGVSTTGLGDTGDDGAVSASGADGKPAGDESSGADDAEEELGKLACNVSPGRGAGGSLMLLVLAALGFRRRRV